MSQMRNLPPIAAAIIWERQIERQLLTYMTRVEDVLGKGWELYTEGQGPKAPIREHCIPKEAGYTPSVGGVAAQYQPAEHGVDGQLFEIVRLRGGVSSPR
jgi:dynein heavy chain 1